MLSIPRPQRVSVRTNAFEITRLPTVVVVQYQIAFEPILKGAAIERRQRYMEHLQMRCAPELFPDRMMYDGGAVGFTTLPVAGLIGPQRVFYLKLNINGQLSQNDFKPNAKERDPCIKITFQRTIAVPIRPEDIAKIYRGDLEALNQSEALTNLLQLIIRQGTNNRFVTRGKAYYDMAQANMRSLEGGRLELRRGIWHSARPADNRLILMIDTVSTAFYPGGQLASVMGNFLKERDIWRISRSSRNWPKMVKYFTKLRVKVLVPAKAKDTTKTIKGFEPEGGLYRFDYHGDIITVQEYYWTVYQVRVQHPKAPGVILKIQGDFKSVVPMEFCELLPGQIFKQKIPEDMTRQMVQFSSVRPNERFGQIMAAAGVYRHQENMAAVNMAVSETPLVVPGNFYPAPTLLYKDRTEPGPRDGKWNVVDRKFIVSTGLVFWGIVNCMPAEVDSRQLEELVHMLRHCCESHGMRVAPPTTVQSCPQGSGVTQALDSVLDQILKGDPANPIRTKSVILVILPNSAADLRSAVKFWGDIKTGVQTQCLRSQGRGGIKRGDQYVNNLLLKINARFGGINFVVGSSPTFLHLHGPLPGPQSQDPKITGGNTIIFGADVSHPGPGVFSKPSVTSIVFSTNKHGAMYAAITEIQDPRVERITKLGQMVFRALKRFALCIQGPPINIIFYRDGLSEGEYDTTAKAEMGDIEGAINQFMASEKGYQSANAPPRPKVTYIVVGKRHHALLFPNPGVRDGLDDGKGNCKGGVAVHEGITQPYRYIADFYLQSHAAIQGTSRSSHYVVLKDDIFIRWGNQRVEALEEYSYALCHMYAKATRAVSIPAPVYYADLVCQRGAFHVNPEGGSFNFEEDSAASVAGSAREQRKAFKLPEWEAVFRPVHNEIKNRMYYL